ncbi:substrate-binding periplasmic protein [Undibacterium sp. Ji67W]|uniref:substrate-binding periplasmic protein n=1 Tax=Undibacterium sp. Ji67W TaxID=3413042 RepID=UPI003BF0677D
MKTIKTLFCFFITLVSSGSNAADLLVLLNEKKQNSESAASEQSFQIDLGELLAERTHREAVFVTRPRKRLANALEMNEADILCGYLPEWLPGNFDWSIGFVDISDVLVTTLRVPAPSTLEDIAGLPVGTTMGFTYPEIEKILGNRFVRDDGPGAEANLRKLAAGRFNYAIVSMATLNYHRRINDLHLIIHPPLTVSKFKSQCALSKTGNVKLSDINKVILDIQRDGSLEKLLKKYNYH